VLNGAAVSWISKCQTSITLSTCEAAYVSSDRAGVLLDLGAGWLRLRFYRSG
jgi:hypothetical protein